MIPSDRFGPANVLRLNWKLQKIAINYKKKTLFSATVPNTLEFANWVGQIKKRKVYVSSTLYRPVPLQHYLYTGNGGKSRDENFLLINQKGEFLLKGHSGNFNQKNHNQSPY